MYVDPMISLFSVAECITLPFVQNPYFATHFNRRAQAGFLSAGNNGQGPTHWTGLAAILVGTVAGVGVASLAMILVSVGIVRFKRRRSRSGCGPRRGPPSEKMNLLSI